MAEACDGSQQRLAMEAYDVGSWWRLMTEDCNRGLQWRFAMQQRLVTEACNDVSLVVMVAWPEWLLRQQRLE